MMVPRLVLLLGLLLCTGALLSDAQHWSHGWYPGGKRELDSYTTSEVWSRFCAVFFFFFIACVDSRLWCEAFPAREQRRVSHLFTRFAPISNALGSFSDFRGDQAVRGRGMQLLETPEERRSEKYSCK